MRIEQLEYLCEVAKRRSMNVAAEKLHIAQQTLSTSIKTLEKELDVKLLERTYQGVFPTPIGQEVISWAEQVLSGLDYLKLKIEAEKETRLTGTLQVATDHGINLLIMPKVVSHFHKFHPQIDLRIAEMTRQEIEAAVLEKRADIGLIAHYDHLPPQTTEDSPLVYVEILTYTFFARVNKANPLAQESSLSLRSLLAYPLALYDLGTSSGERLLGYFEQFGQPRIWPTYNPFVSSQLVSDDQAVSIAVKVNNYMPPLFGNDYGGSIVTIPLKEHIPFYSSYCIHRDALDNPTIDRFVETLLRMT